MQKTAASAKHPLVGYPLGLLIWLGAFALGNVLGRILASLNGWHDLDFDKPGGVVYAAMQSGLGAYLGLLASKAWLGDSKFVKLWLLVFVFVVACIVVAGCAIALYLGRLEIFGWSLLSLIVGTVVTEVVRRIPNSDIEY